MSEKEREKRKTGEIRNPEQRNRDKKIDFYW
jgi:hypothetical protein